MNVKTMTKVKERPILFSGPMIRAILDGKKTQTRRVVKAPVDYVAPGGLSTSDPSNYGYEDDCGEWWKLKVDDETENQIPCPYGRPGDRLWVRETWRCFGGREYEYQHEPRSIIFKATADLIDCGPWRPSIFMPRWASRLMLDVTRVRVERLKDISHEDAVAEGCYRIEPCEAYPHGNAWGRAGYAALWQEINGKTGPKSWDANPWVWVVEFERRGR